MSFLNYPVTETQTKMLEIAGKLADTFAQRSAQQDWEGRFPVENFADLHRSGYLMLTLPRELGGWGVSLLDAMRAQYRLAQGDASTALVMSMHLIHTARLFDGRTEFSPFLRQIARNMVVKGAMINSAVSEPVTGSPSRGGRAQTTAYRQADGSWCIRGRKTFTTGSHALHYFLVGCSIEDEASGLEPLTADRGNFLVPHALPGVRIEDTWNTLSMRGSGSNDLILDDVCVGPEAYVDTQLAPVLFAKQRQAAWAALTAPVYLGIAQAARDEAIDFARKRRPNSLNQAIATVPHIQDKVGRIELLLLQAQSLLFGVAEQFSNDVTSVDASLFGAAKYVATNSAVEIVDLAMRVVGAASLALSLPMQRYYRDVRAGLHNPPMDDVVIAMLAKQALEPPTAGE
ncbi:MAG TPA: acyl-CoA dehydrogenase family protein [Dictyobacter sp.]|nr:acyl-CoA dehydrogenase family protein [Dictyobacter sp.]